VSSSPRKPCYAYLRNIRIVGIKPRKGIKGKELDNVEISLYFNIFLVTFEMRNKRLRKKLKEIGYRDEIIDRIIDF
jgi:hypothetical protein